jgi:hypothetical protein
MADLAPIAKPATGKDTDAFRVKLADWLRCRNSEWLDEWQDWDTGERPTGVKDLCSAWQAMGHLVKWGHATGRIDARFQPQNLKVNQRDGFAAAIYFRSDDDRKAVNREMNVYMRRLASDARAKVYKAHPELFPEEWPDTDFDPDSTHETLQD